MQSRSERRLERPLQSFSLPEKSTFFLPSTTRLTANGAMKKYVFLLTLGVAFASAYGQTPTPTPPCAAGCDPGSYRTDCPNPPPKNTPDALEKYGTAQEGIHTFPLFWDVYLPSPSPPP